ncbi:MAG TPA: tetratricopeptide repeat protein [Gemmataceae bacterium]|nr:tetratricopeptide repeat protein [Gemmataceae bacterium]
MRTVVLLASLAAAATARGGLHYSGETPAELPSQWRGFLLDHRALRLVGVAPAPGTPLHLLREQYEDAATRLEAAAKKRALTADEAADLGALHVRLGRPVKAVEVLRRALRDHPDHFRLAANLGTAWQAQGDLDEAARSLQQAVRLAPARWKPFEEAHLKLVRLRQKESKGATTLDGLFGVTFVGPSGKPEPGKIDPAARKKLPDDDVAIVQQLALWLPADARLLWQLGELANAHGDVRTAAAILEGVVTEFAFTTPEVRERRKLYRAAADEIARLPDSEHAKYRGDVVFKSTRPITRQFDPASLPEIRPDGVNFLPWPVLAETVIDKPFRPRFLKHLEKLDGKQVALTGFMQPVTTDVEASGFMLIEYPIGCWFCETPEPAGIIYVEVAGGKSVPVKRGRIKVEGTLKLNKSDPEDFLYTLSGATVRDPD